MKNKSRKLKSILAIIFSVVMTCNAVCVANGMSRTFSDVGTTHWAYNAVSEMSSAGVINGYTDGTFKPQGLVTRAEFAKLLVTALNVDKSAKCDVSFVDIADSYWGKQYIDIAGKYLTGYKSGDKYYFYPDRPAVREDMAVALVLSMGLENEEYNLSTLNRFLDADKISENVKKYVAIAVENGIMKGNSNGMFCPNATLTRAEAAQLIYNAVEVEKIVLKEVSGDQLEKVVYDPEKEDSYEEEDEDTYEEEADENISSDINVKEVSGNQIEKVIANFNEEEEFAVKLNKTNKELVGKVEWKLGNQTDGLIYIFTLNIPVNGKTIKQGFYSDQSDPNDIDRATVEQYAKVFGFSVEDAPYGELRLKYTKNGEDYVAVTDSAKERRRFTIENFIAFIINEDADVSLYELDAVTVPGNQIEKVIANYKEEQKFKVKLNKTNKELDGKVEWKLGNQTDGLIYIFTLDIPVNGKTIKQGFYSDQSDHSDISRATLEEYAKVFGFSVEDAPRGELRMIYTKNGKKYMAETNFSKEGRYFTIENFIAFIINEDAEVTLK